MLWYLSTMFDYDNLYLFIALKSMCINKVLWNK